MTPLSPTALEAAAKAAQAKRTELQHAPLARIYPDLCTAAITAYLAQAEKDGWVLVPVNPTDAMIAAGCDNNPTQWNEGTDLGFAADVANGIYRAMLAAAQNGG